MLLCWSITYILFTVRTVTPIIFTWFQHISKDIDDSIIFRVYWLHGIIMGKIGIVPFIIIGDGVIDIMRICERPLLLLNDITSWRWWRKRWLWKIVSEFLRKRHFHFFCWYFIRIADFESPFLEGVLTIGWLIVGYLRLLVTNRWFFNYFTLNFYIRIGDILPLVFRLTGKMTFIWNTWNRPAIALLGIDWAWDFTGFVGV